MFGADDVLLRTFVGWTDASFCCCGYAAATFIADLVGAVAKKIMLMIGLIQVCCFLVPELL